MEQKHSGFGIASFVSSIVSGIFLFLIFVIAGVMEESTPGGINEESSAAMALGLCLLAFLFVIRLRKYSGLKDLKTGS